MARPRDIPELRPDGSFAQAAAATVRVRGRELFDHADGVLDSGDIERVHDMRVASRRLRAALEVYAPCFDAAACEPVLREVKALADALGDRRDPDVQLEDLDAFAAPAGEEDRPGIALLSERLRAEQADANVRLAAALAAAGADDLAGRLQALAATADTGAWA